MAKNRLTGLTIEIGGDTTQLTKALKAPNDSIRELQTQIRALDKALEIDPTNIDLLEQKMRILSNAIDQTEDKLNILKTAQEQFVKSGKDIDSSEYIELEKQIALTQQSLNKLNDQKVQLDVDISNVQNADGDLNNLQDTIEDTSEAAKDSADGFTIMKGAIADLVSEGIQYCVSSLKDMAGNLLNLSEATEEYRSMLAKVQGSADTFGYSLEFAKNQYSEFYRYLGDDQMATNAITNLMGMKVSTDTVSDSATAAIAVWSAYGDSIPIEGLTESINESAQVAAVTGSLADAINWASKSNDEWSDALSENADAQKAFNKAVKEGETVEDAFTAALAACNDTQERADLIATTLNKTYGKSKETYDELSESILDTNDAELELKEAQAELGETVAPLNNELTRLQSKVLSKLSPQVEKVTEDFLAWSEGVDWDGFADTIANLFSIFADGIGWLIKNIQPATALLAGFTAALIAHKNAQTIANTAMLVTKGTMALFEGVTKTATLATNAHTIATNAATVAQKALNLAQNASPIGLLTTLVIGATTALGAYVAMKSQELTETQKTGKAIQEEIAARQELQKTQDEAIASGLGEISNLNSLASELDNLVDANGRVTEGYEARVKFILGELNSALGTEMQLNNGVIEGYDQLSGSISDLIQKKRAEIILEAQLPAYKEALTKLTEAQAKAYQLEAEYQQAKMENDQKIIELQAELAKASDDYTRKTIEGNILQLQGETEAKRTLYEQQSQIVKGYWDDVNNYEINATRLASDNAEEWAKIETSVVTNKANSNAEKKQLIQEQIQYEEEQLAYLEEKYSGTNDEIEKQQIESHRTRIEELQNQLNAVTSTVEEETPTIANANKELAARALEAYANDTEKYFGASADKYREVIAGIRSEDPDVRATALSTAQEMYDQLSSKNDEYSSVGANILRGIINGANSASGSLYSSMRTIANRTLSAFKSALDINSPSKEFEDLSKYIPEGIASGIDKNARKAINSISTLAEDMENKFDPQISLDSDDAYVNLTGRLANLIMQPMMNNLATLLAEIQKANNFGGNITVESPIKIDLNGKPIYQDVVRRTTRSQKNRSAFQGA